MKQEKNLADGLEAVEVNDTVAAEGAEKSAKAVKMLTEEEVAALNAAADKIRAFGVSPKFAKVMELIPVWHLKTSDALAAKKKEVIEFFGGTETFKDYIDGEFQAELEVINGMTKAVSTMNNINSFYARRKEVNKKSKMTQINIGGTIYEVNADYLVSVSTLPASERRELVLAHADTKQATGIEIL